MSGAVSYLSSWWYPKEEPKTNIKISLPISNDSERKKSTVPVSCKMDEIKEDLKKSQSQAPLPPSRSSSPAHDRPSSSSSDSSSSTLTSASAEEPEYVLFLPGPKKKGWLW